MARIHFPEIAQLGGHLEGLIGALLCGDDSPHSRWTELATSESELTVDDKDLLAPPCDQIDGEMEVEAYDAGLMTLLTARLD
ncbi:MAG: hypothetical protein CL931_10725 [Deltaproteobacteria bacterium]|nr:hypothetical protein [Deltaproteobacteria bacterium]